ncbi:hypothetical protein E4U33_003460 [Claviceps sp. LM78 group G4]|nr:hypothetical protein E4U33_003460 [Claviceps sp. LM78 group G4]
MQGLVHGTTPGPPWSHGPTQVDHVNRLHRRQFFDFPRRLQPRPREPVGKGPYTNAIALLGAPNRNSYPVDRRKRAQIPSYFASRPCDGPDRARQIFPADLLFKLPTL